MVRVAVLRVVSRKSRTRLTLLSMPQSGGKIVSPIIELFSVSIIVIGCQPEETTLHGGQSHSWSAEEGKREQKKKSGSITPTPHTAGSENK